ncbi:MAG: DUF4124 domain-containing protein [Gammaproteobacteria bacterium]|jgi:hypothetical protein
MNSTTPGLLVTILACSTALPAFAVGVHKWVDEKGVTHYSDEAPEAIETTLIDLPEPAVRQADDEDIEDDYYSISKQWERMNRERLEREKLELERAKIAAAVRPPPPRTVYVEKSGSDRIIPVYADFRYRKHYRHRKPYRGYRQPRLRLPPPAVEITGGFPTQ